MIRTQMASAERSVLKEGVVAGLIGAVVVDLNDNATKRPGFARLHDARGSVAVALNLDGEAAKVPRCIRICGNGEQATADRNRLDGSANCSHW